jgi:inosine/xanthosine triphosphate pyrophosphatase family protein
MIHLVFINENSENTKDIINIVNSTLSSIITNNFKLKFKIHLFDIEVPKIQSTSTVKVANDKVRLATTLMDNNGYFAGMYAENDEIYILVEDTGFYCQTKKVNNKIINHSDSGFPGALMKFYMSGFCTTEEANQIFCMEYGNQICHIETTIAIMHFKANKVITISKQDFGKVANSPQNSLTGKSFEWDPVFVPDETNGQKNESKISYAQLSKGQKYISSIRKNAFSEAIQTIYSRVI